MLVCGHLRLLTMLRAASDEQLSLTFLPMGNNIAISKKYVEDCG